MARAETKVKMCGERQRSSGNSKRYSGMEL